MPTATEQTQRLAQDVADLASDLIVFLSTGKELPADQATHVLVSLARIDRELTQLIEVVILAGLAECHDEANEGRGRRKKS